jgi:hypothetical protein
MNILFSGKLNDILEISSGGAGLSETDQPSDCGFVHDQKMAAILVPSALRLTFQIHSIKLKKQANTFRDNQHLI